MDNFFAIEMQSAGTQVLESAYIVGTSKKIETIKSRYEFLLQRIAALKQGQNNPQYTACMQQAIATYQQVYYDKPIQDYQLAILYNPQDFDLSNFYCVALVNAMKRFCGDQTFEINAMKKEAAKVKRREKASDVIRATIQELQSKCQTVLSYSASLEELQSLEDTFNKPQ